MSGRRARRGADYSFHLFIYSFILFFLSFFSSFFYSVDPSFDPACAWIEQLKKVHVSSAAGV